MKWNVEIKSADILAVQNLVEQQGEHPFVTDRYERNVHQPPPSITKENTWLTVVMCLITTQNRSGSGSAVDTFLRQKPFPLSLEKLGSISDIENYTSQTLSKLRIRRWKLSTEFAVSNYHSLEYGEWNTINILRDNLMEQRLKEPEFDNFILERSAAKKAQELFRGIGPKQSRNFWQDLGLTRFEIPLDSRILRWSQKTMGFMIPSSGLSNERFYCQIMDAIQKLCFQANVLPCILDASIFSSFEN